jgi:DNA-directed RNA polymerase specialized sigma24 family protein
MSAEEIAEALGVPERAVQSVITSGKSRLLSALNQG